MARTTGALTVAVVLLAGWTVARGQAQAGSGSTDIMPALVVEVRALRIALEQMTSAGPRVQLALGRLQLQEQRITTSIKRADDARNRLAQLQREQAEMQQQLRGFESELKTPTPRAEGQGPSHEEFVRMVEHHKQRLASHNAEVQRIAADEATYAAEVATEQARWTEINQRLEELERALRPLK